MSLKPDLLQLESSVVALFSQKSHRYAVDELSFVLLTTGLEARLECRDKSGKPVSDDVAISGADPELHQAFAAFFQAQRSASTAIGWGTDGHVKTISYPILTEFLIKRGLVTLNESGKTIGFAADTEASLVCNLSQVKEDVWSVNFGCDLDISDQLSGDPPQDPHQADLPHSFLLVTPSLIIVKNTAFRLRESVEFAVPLPSLETKLTSAELKRFLAVLLTCIPSLEVKCSPWQFIRKEEDLQSLPFLFIDEVTEDLATIVRVEARPYVQDGESTESSKAFHLEASQPQSKDAGMLNSTTLDSPYHDLAWSIHLDLDSKIIAAAPSFALDTSRARHRFLRLCERLARKTRSERVCQTEDGRFLLPAPLAISLFSEELGEVLTAFRIFNAKALDRLGVRSSTPSMKVVFGQEKINYLDHSQLARRSSSSRSSSASEGSLGGSPVVAEAQVLLDGVSVRVEDLLSRMHPVGYVELEKGERVLLPPRFIRSLQILLEGQDLKGKGRKGSRNDDNTFPLTLTHFDVPLLADLQVSDASTTNDGKNDNNSEENKQLEWTRASRQFLLEMAALENQVSSSGLSSSETPSPSAPTSQTTPPHEGSHEGSIAATGLPPVQATLRPYQVYGVRWLLHLQRYQRGGILADDMGLGKTLQALTVLAAAHDDHQRGDLSPSKSKSNSVNRGASALSSGRTRSRTKMASASIAAESSTAQERSPGSTEEGHKPLSLVVVPKSLLHNWVDEVRRFTPWLSVYIYHGTERSLATARQHDVIITTYATLRLQIEDLSSPDYLYVVLDEAQAIKNFHSQTFQAVAALRTRHRLALTGTPVENSLSEVFSLFSFLNPGMFRTLGHFQKAYLKPIQVDGDTEVAGILRRRIAPYVLRRLKSDVLSDLPEKIEQTIFIELEPQHAAMYVSAAQLFAEQLKRQIDEFGMERSRMHIFQALLQLRQLASCPASRVDGIQSSSKLPVLLEMVREAVSGGHKVLIFTHFLQSLEEITEALSHEGIGHRSVTGATDQRGDIVREFSHDKSLSALVMTLKTGGVGLNLVAADTVFLYEPWWNLAAEAQAIDRCHRIGQRVSVNAYRLVTRGTIEEKMLLLQERKREVFDKVLVGDGAMPKMFSAGDIDFLLAVN